MKWSFATVGVVLLGIIGVSIILLFQRVTTNNENDYYLLKEVTEAAMIDAIDISYYRETGDLKIVKEKFIENFIRRYAESTLFVTNKYIISFYDIMETPPKVSVIINTGLGEITVAGNTDEYDIKNKLDAILEYTGKNTFVTPGSGYYNNPYITEEIQKEYYAMISVNDGSFNEKYSVKIPEKLGAPNIKNVKIKDVKKIEEKNWDQGKLGIALLQNELSYNDVITNYNQYINSFATDVSVNNLGYFNCSNNGNAGYECDDVNKHFVTISGKNNDTNKNKVIFKYQITWSYDEYEFS